MTLEAKDIDGLLNNENSTKYEIKAYKRRWLILFIFNFYSCVNCMQWIEYCTIGHATMKYYGVTSVAVEWTSIIFMAMYPILVVPATMIMNKKGLRTAGLIGCIGTFLGTAIKVFSLRRNLFSMVMLGQTLVAATQLFILCLPPKIASTWFQPNEVSTACALGVFGAQLGGGIGFILPPFIVRNSDNIDEIEEGLTILNWLYTALIAPIAIIILFYFPNQPPLPPCEAQARLRETKEEFATKTFFISVKKLFTNKGFIIHIIAYSINIAVLSAMGTLLTEFVLHYFEGANKDAGGMGFLMVITGMVGSVPFGILLDKTHKYKEISIFTNVWSAIAVVGLIYSLQWRSMLWSYLTCGLLGLFSSAYFLTGFEFSIELTFPSEESTTTGILLAVSQIFAVIFTMAASYMNMLLSSYWVLMMHAVFLFAGSLITLFVPNKLLRQEAFKGTKNPDDLRSASRHGSQLLFIK